MIEGVSKEVAVSIIDNDIKGADLLQLQREDLRDLGLSKIAHLRRVQDAIERLKADQFLTTAALVGGSTPVHMVGVLGAAAETVDEEIGAGADAAEQVVDDAVARTVAGLKAAQSGSSMSASSALSPARTVRAVGGGGAVGLG